MHLMREVLDKELFDKRGSPIGRIDGIVLAIVCDGPPRVTDVHIGGVVLARRLHPRLARLAARLRRGWSDVPPPTTRIPLTALRRHGVAWATDDVDARDTPALEWELWLRTHVIARLPGGRR